MLPRKIHCIVAVPHVAVFKNSHIIFHTTEHTTAYTRPNGFHSRSLQIFGVRTAAAGLNGWIFWRNRFLPFLLFYAESIQIVCANVRIVVHLLKLWMRFFPFGRQINNLINHRFPTDAWRAHFGWCITTSLLCVDCSQFRDIFLWRPLLARCVSWWLSSYWIINWKFRLCHNYTHSERIRGENKWENQSIFEPK